MTVVTTVLNEGSAVKRLLAGLVPQLSEVDELIVVDGGSTDSTLAVLEQYAHRDSRVRVHLAKGANISAGRNAGIGHARNSTIAITDAGCDLSPIWLDALRAAFTVSPPPDLVTGVYRVSADSAFQQALLLSCFPDPQELRRPTPLVRLYGGLLGRVFEPALCTGRSMAVSVDAWKAVGGFPEHLRTGEDVSFGRAVARRGYKCVLALDAEVTWHQRPTLPSTARMYFRYGQGGGRSRDLLLIGRDLLRAIAYVLGPALVAKGGRRARVAVLSAAAFYLSLPVSRSARHRSPPTATAQIPLALAVKDLAKAAGCLRALIEIAATRFGKRRRRLKPSVAHATP